MATLIDGKAIAAGYGGDFVYNHDEVNKPKKQVLVSPDGKHTLYLATWQSQVLRS
jgi:hypothetical protein